MRVEFRVTLHVLAFRLHGKMRRLIRHVEEPRRPGPVQVGEEIDRGGIDAIKAAGGTYTVPDITAFRAAFKDVHKPYEGKVWPAGLVDKIRTMQE